MCKARFVFSVLTPVVFSLVMTSFMLPEVFAADEETRNVTDASKDALAVASAPTFAGWLQVKNKVTSVTTTASSLWPTTLGEVYSKTALGKARTIPANTIPETEPSTIRINQRGLISTTMAGSATVQLTFNSPTATSIFATATVPLESGLTNKYWELDLIVTVRTNAPGVAADLSIDGYFLHDGLAFPKINQFVPSTASPAPKVFFNVNNIVDTTILKSSGAITITSTYGEVY